jgi:hypothetical protein
MTPENNHMMTLKRAIEEAYREGARSRDAEVKALADLLDECAAEIEVYVKAEYHYPDVHPCQVRKYEAGMELVNEARAAAKKSRGEA